MATTELEDIRATIHEGYDILRANTFEAHHWLINRLEDSHLLMLESADGLAGAAVDGLRAVLPSELKVVKGER